MPKLKTHKAIAKRVTITKTGKVLKRYAGQNHFNTRDSGNITRKKRRDVSLSPSYNKTIRTIMPNW